ncbi:hypothetical protein Z517_09475 [Fonsecaea pedrosoi CBS 271.37]|uniref:Unplaced genomic scaffold supercont1.6, whole genome shotgun sequence n=1 Tax=Fonsecaea pedrosoi CBS 271.37 TaxID=1442368 RepID=A0A0D2GXH6_9EURO|nr:uncharacterized protein Z517_09475 [Fonsecaea pedrosoi CBS 271.37]KIW77029.1 hypothetical protein Z517_09475 [Fonsecaea pedrosoi CBS 271.37]
MNPFNAVPVFMEDHGDPAHPPTTPPDQTIGSVGSSSFKSSSSDELVSWSPDVATHSPATTRQLEPSSEEQPVADRIRALLDTLTPELQAVITHMPQAYHRSSYWTEFPLCSADFASLKVVDLGMGEMLKNADCLYRYDYDAANKILIFRTPVSNAHGYVQSMLHHNIMSQLEDIASCSNKVSTFIRELDASARRPIRYTGSERHPDISFGHTSQNNPAVVGELAFPPTNKDLHALAEEYHQKMRGVVNVVFGLMVRFWCDENSTIKTSATLRVWRPDVVGQEVNIGAQPRYEEFIVYDESGERIIDGQAGLRLSLEDFACRRSVDEGEFGRLDQHEIFISLPTLQDILDAAAERHAILPNTTQQQSTK